MRSKSTSRGGDWPPQAARVRLGSRLLENAYAPDGTLLLRAGAKIETLSNLIRLNEPDVRFGEARSVDVPLDMQNEAALDAADAAGQDQAAAEFAARVEHASALKQEAVHDVTEVFSRLDDGGKVDIDLAQKSVAALVEDLFDDPRALISLAQIKDADAYTYTHSVNVSILTMHLAMHTGFRDEIEEIGLGAILHDVGKIQIPSQILNKPGPLMPTEMQTMKTHSDLGVRMLAEAGETRSSVLGCVQSHHERVSGTGYPQGKRGRHICPCAMVVAIADVYDALTTDRPYRPAMTPKGAMLLMTQKMQGDFREDLLQCFVSMVGFFPIGSEVVLSNGCTARVINHSATHPDRPTVVLLSSPQGQPIPGSPAADLGKEREVSIVRFAPSQPQQGAASAVKAA